MLEDIATRLSNILMVESSYQFKFNGVYLMDMIVDTQIRQSRIKK